MFTIDELLRATGGRLISRGKISSVRAISIDSRTINRSEAFLALKGDNFDGHAFVEAAVKKGACCVIIGPSKAVAIPKGVSVIHVRDSVKALGDIARFHRQRFSIPVIAVTGSNGKTTAKEMLGKVLSARFNVLKTAGTRNNHIGLPMTLLGLRNGHDCAVLELGTNHFGEISYLAHICLATIGVITNIGPSHLEYFGDLKGVLREKASLIGNLVKPYIAVLNSDDPLLKEYSHKKKHRAFFMNFGINNGAEFLASDIGFDKSILRFKVNKSHSFSLRTIGSQNIYNALSAIACARILGMQYAQISKRLYDFEFPDGRLKLIRVKQKSFIDDTYNSSPASLKHALAALEGLKTDGKKILVMGDMLELGKQKEFFHYDAGIEAARVCDKLIAVGELSRLALEAARKTGFDSKNLFACRNSAEARQILFRKLFLKKEDIVLVKGSRAMKMESILK